MCLIYIFISGASNEQEQGAVGGVAPSVNSSSRRLRTPPMCQDVTSTPKNSPKRTPKNFKNSNGISPAASSANGSKED